MPARRLPRSQRALKRKEEPSYQGTFTGARKYVLQTFATTQSAMMKRRVAQFHVAARDCPVCHGKRLSRRRCRSRSRASTSPRCRGCR